MKTRILLFLSALLLTFSVRAQNVITVDNTVGADADFNDLQSAINTAQNGDVIYVHASEVNYGNIIIDKSLSLIGFSHSDLDKKTIIDEVDLLDNASNVRVTGFHVTGPFTLNNDDTLVTNLVIENNYFDNIIYFGGDALTDGLIVRGNIIYRIGSNSVTWTKYTNAIISNNIITDYLYVNYHESVEVSNNLFLNESYVVNVGNATGDLAVQDCIFYASVNSVYDPNSDGVLFQNCLTYNDINAVTNLVGTNNINDVDPQFINATDDLFNPDTDNYNLQMGSPAIGMGNLGDDIGLYSTNTNFSFNNFGFTAGIPVVTITSITSQVEQGGQLEVVIESNSN